MIRYLRELPNTLKVQTQYNHTASGPISVTNRPNKRFLKKMFEWSFFFLVLY